MRLRPHILRGSMHLTNALKGSAAIDRAVYEMVADQPTLVDWNAIDPSRVFEILISKRYPKIEQYLDVTRLTQIQILKLCKVNERYTDYVDTKSLTRTTVDHARLSVKDFVKLRIPLHLCCSWNRARQTITVAPEFYFSESFKHVKSGNVSFYETVIATAACQSTKLMEITEDHITSMMSDSGRSAKQTIASLDRIMKLRMNYSGSTYYVHPRGSVEICNRIHISRALIDHLEQLAVMESLSGSIRVTAQLECALKRLRLISYE